MRQPPLNRLRVRLTLLYMLAGVALVAGVGGGVYGLLGAYFQRTTDLALQHRLADELRRLDLPVPPELAAADDAWAALSGDGWPGGLLPGSLNREREPRKPKNTGDDHRGRGGGDNDGDDARLDGELAAVSVLPLTADGTPLTGTSRTGPSFPPDPSAVRAALERGSDLRTVASPGRDRRRVLTYRLPAGSIPALLQLARSLADQERVLQELLLGFTVLGGVSVLGLGGASWWLAGRSLAPARESWERQQQFVANAGHELRTPLTLIRASAEVALRQLPPADDDQRVLWGDVLQEADHMTRLVEDLLLLSRLDAGRLPLDVGPVPLAPLLDDLQRQVGRRAQERGVAVRVDAAAGDALADPTRLRQVLLIVLENARRHTPAGGTVRLASEIQGKRVRVTIGDTGSGIAPADLPHVFDRFYRADRARGTEGTGLGLAIAKSLVEAQRGAIRIASQPGAGTTVEVTLPRAGAERG